MALVMSHTLKNGMTAPNAYHIVYKTDVHKRPVDDIDTHGARPDDLPHHMWKAGVYARIGIAIYVDKAARDAGKPAIAVISVNPTERPNNDFEGEQIFWSEEKLTFTVDLESTKDTLGQAYDHLLTLSEYASAVND